MTDFQAGLRDSAHQKGKVVRGEAKHRIGF
jgi:hypothetical protein